MEISRVPCGENLRRRRWKLFDVLIFLKWSIFLVKSACSVVCCDQPEHEASVLKSHLTSHATHENCKVDSSNFDDWFLFPGPTGPPTTKILYFTNRSVTPFMSSINKKIGEITLRDFKVLFDRPGFYRFHFKSVDQEFGMVKEEVCKAVINN